MVYQCHEEVMDLLLKVTSLLTPTTPSSLIIQTQPGNQITLPVSMILTLTKQRHQIEGCSQTPVIYTLPPLINYFMIYDEQGYLIPPHTMRSESISSTKSASIHMGQLEL